MSILDILLQLKNTVKKRLPLILIISLILAGITAFIISQKPAVYVAESKIFPLSANSARSSSSPMSQLQQQFGLPTEGEGEVYDIAELINSKRLSFNVANSKTSNKKYKKLYQWLVADYNSELGLFKNEIVLSKEKKDSLDNIITGSGLMLSKVQVEKSKNGYTALRVRAYEKELAKEINENILIELSNFYIDFVTEKPRKDLEVIQAMRDSLSIEMSSIEKAIAGVQDKSTFATKAYVGLPQIKLRRQQAEITSLYTTAVSALQNARFKLLSESPIFQILDYPGEPYRVEKESWKPKTATVFILSFILLSLWFCRKIFAQIIIEELKKA